MATDNVTQIDADSEDSKIQKILQNIDTCWTMAESVSLYWRDNRFALIKDSEEARIFEQLILRLYNTTGGMGDYMCDLEKHLKIQYQWDCDYAWERGASSNYDNKYEA